MSESSTLSSNAPDQDYIGKKVAIALLEQILKDEKIDEDVTKQILEQFIKNMEDSLENPDNIQDVPITFPEMSHPSNILLTFPEMSHPSNIRLTFPEMSHPSNIRLLRRRPCPPC